MNRKTFLQTAGSIALGTTVLSQVPLSGMAKETPKPAGPAPAAGQRPFPLYDLHIHRSEFQDAKKIYENFKKSGFQMFGIIEHVGSDPITDDKGLRQYINETKDIPCFIGLQVMKKGWSKNLSKDLIDKVDYVLWDPQIIPNGNKYGDTLHTWEHDCYIENEDEFMEVNLKHYEEVILCEERLDIFGWPLYLPPCIARDYFRLWTHERQDYVIDLCRKRGCAIEINDYAHCPHPEFILRAKQAGLKFTFGSDTRDYRSFRLDYCQNVAKLCGLTEDDFFIPKRHR